MIKSVSAILLISPDARRLAAFYRDVLGLGLKDEVHDGIPLHYGCELGDVHFAIHPAEGWPGVPAREAQSPVIALGTEDIDGIAASLKVAGLKVPPPTDHGFAMVMAFRDPDGNHIEIVQMHERSD
jgi:catechol 2,3-dioxygenase-like lactoylglutathione lyase family enzyme